MKYLIKIFLFFLSIPCLAQCDTSLWKHIYHKERFVIIASCYSVKGTIRKVVKEKDGDYHIQVRLNAKDTKQLLSENNYKRQDSCLVIEVICVNEVKQSNAKDACKNCPQKVYIPKRGEQVKVTGSFVYDKQHQWSEIHPVTEIEKIK